MKSRFEHTYLHHHFFNQTAVQTLQVDHCFCILEVGLERITLLMLKIVDEN